MENLVRRFYDDIWNKFDTSPEVIDGIISPKVTFRGTLEHSTTDIDGFKRYVREIEASFPDFHQRIVATWVDGETIIARMHWSATHMNDFRGYKPTGKKFEYPGVGIFKIRDGRMVDVWVCGDTYGMFKVIGKPNA